jgi:23S rRNA-intervening sequence protein
MRNYEDLQVWRKAHSLTLLIYKSTQCFPSEEKLGLTNQIRRSCASIGANLTEGCERRPDPEMRRFVQIAIGIGRGIVISSAARARLGFHVENIFRPAPFRSQRSDAMLSSLSQKLTPASHVVQLKAKSKQLKADSLVRFMLASKHSRTNWQKV